jgi:hypothetical protein
LCLTGEGDHVDGQFSQISIQLTWEKINYKILKLCWDIYQVAAYKVYIPSNYIYNGALLSVVIPYWGRVFVSMD